MLRLPCREHCFIACGMAALPTAALAHGGLNALEGLLPFFIAMLCIAAGQGIWMLFTLFLRFAAPESLSFRKLSVYRALSWILIVMLTLVALFGMLLSPAILLTALTFLAITALGMKNTSELVRGKILQRDDAAAAADAV